MVTAWPPVPKRMFVVPVKNDCKFFGAECLTPGVCRKVNLRRLTLLTNSHLTDILPPSYNKRDMSTLPCPIQNNSWGENDNW